MWKTQQFHMEGWGDLRFKLIFPVGRNDTCTLYIVQHIPGWCDMCGHGAGGMAPYWKPHGSVGLYTAKTFLNIQRYVAEGAHLKPYITEQSNIEQ